MPRETDTRPGDGGSLVPVKFSVFAVRCPHFLAETPVNNGYGCTHPECDWSDTVDGVEYGCCYNFSCPLVNTLTAGDPDDEVLATAHGIDLDDKDDDPYVIQWRAA